MGNKPALPGGGNEPDNQRWLERRSLSVLILLGAVGAVLIGLVFFTLFVHGLGADQLFWGSNLTSRDLYDVMRSTVAATAVVAGSVATVVALRRQFATERKLDLDRASSNLALEQDRRDRFVKAVELLGSESTTIQLGGVYALEELSMEWMATAQRQKCVDVLCSYLRAKPRQSAVADAEVVLRSAIESVLIRHLKQGSDLHWGPVEVNLSSAHLLVPEPYSGLHFLKRVDMSSCEFLLDPGFDSCIFEDGVLLSDATFKRALNIRDCTFKKPLELRVINCALDVYIAGCEFRGGLSITSSQFKWNLRMSKLDITAHLNLEECSIERDLSIQRLRLAKGVFVIDGCSMRRLSILKSRMDETDRTTSTWEVFCSVNNPSAPFSPYKIHGTDFWLAVPNLEENEFVGSQLKFTDCKVNGADWPDEDTV